MKTLRHLILCISFLFIASGISGQKLEFDHTHHSWGTVNQKDGKVSHRFTFTNTGDKPLRIFAMNPCCGCLVRERPTGTIAPGTSSHITLECNIGRREDSVRFTLEVLTNEPVAPKSRLVMEGFVKAGNQSPEELYRMKTGNLMFKTNHMAFNHLSKSRVVTDTLDIYNAWDQPMDISFRRVPEHIQVQAMPEQLAPGEEGFLIFTYDATKTNDYGLVMERFQVVTND